MVGVLLLLTASLSFVLLYNFASFLKAFVDVMHGGECLFLPKDVVSQGQSPRLCVLPQLDFGVDGFLRFAVGGVQRMSLMALQDKTSDLVVRYFGEDPTRKPFEDGKLPIIICLPKVSETIMSGNRCFSR